MALTRNQRRRAKARNEALALVDASNTAMVLARKAIRDANLSRAKVYETRVRISSVYSGSGAARASGHGVSHARDWTK